MKRHTFRTKNILELHSLIYISIMLIVLLAFFLVIGNVGGIVSSANLDSGQADPVILKSALEDGPEKIVASKTDPGASPDSLFGFRGGNGESKAALYGDLPILSSLASQLTVMEQSFDFLYALDDLEGYELLVAAKSDCTEEEMEQIAAYVEAGGNVWFPYISDSLCRMEEAEHLFGIEQTGGRKTWPGIRFSGDIALGTVMEAEKYKVSALELSLSNQIKLYASALPKEYKEIENKDLPPLIWRYVPEENAGSVYVCNGDFMDTEVFYYMLPTIFSELQSNYVYGILNSYCVFVEGFPYARNEERESWQHLYSRDKMSIAQDLLSAQFLRYYTNYGARFTYFSKDFEIFRNTEDKDLKFYTDNIVNSMALLAGKENDLLYLEQPSEKLDIGAWRPGFSFTQGDHFCLPVNFTYTIENNKEENFTILASMMGLGYYAFTNDVDDLLDYEGTADIWDDYCKEQEVVFGEGVAIGGWMERVTAAQALERLYNHLSADTKISYHPDSVQITTDAKEYWLILKGKTQEIEITGGTAEPIGERCWLIKVESPQVVITYK